MTISIESSNRVSYNSNGAQTIYAFSFKVLNVTDLKVYENTVISAANIQVTLNADQDNSPGGTITYLNNTPANGVNILIKRVVDIEQQTDYTIYGGFPPETHELALDNLTQIVQQQQEQVDRSLSVPINDDGTTSLELPPYVSRRGLVWDLNIKKLINTLADPDDVAGNAAASAAAALISENNAAISETNAAASSVASSNANNAATISAAAALVSETNAAASSVASSNANNAATISAAAALVSETNAAASANSASSSASASSLSAGSSNVSAGNSNVSAGNSASSAASAATSAAAALVSENNAATSATQAGAAAGIIMTIPSTGGTSTAYTLSLGVGGPVTGTTYRMRINQDNTSTAATLSIDATAAKLIVVPFGGRNNIVPGELKAELVADLYYNGTSFLLLNPQNGRGTFTWDISDTVGVVSKGQSISSETGFWHLNGNRMFIDGRFVIGSLGTLINTNLFIPILIGLPIEFPNSTLSGGAIFYGQNMLLPAASMITYNFGFTGSETYIAPQIWNTTDTNTSMKVNHTKVSTQLQLSGSYNI